MFMYSYLSSILVRSVQLLALTSLLTPAISSQALAQDNSVEASPVISFETPVFKFGKVRQGEEIRHDFKFTNRGSQTLIIEDVRPSCGCTTAGQWVKSLEPGQSGVIPIKLNTDRFKGPLTKSVTVRSNDPKRTNVYLKIEGEVWTALSVDPMVAAFPAIKDLQQVSTKSIRISNQTETPLVIRNLRVASGPFKASIKTVEEGKLYDITVETVPPLSYGANRADIQFETNLKESPTVKVSASAYVMAPVQVVPNRVMLPNGVLQKPLKKYVTVLTYEDKVLEVSDIQVSVEGVEVEVSQLNNGKHHRLIMTFPQGMNVDALKDASLKLKTSHETFSDFEVPIGSYRALNAATKP